LETHPSRYGAAALSGPSAKALDPDDLTHRERVVGDGEGTELDRPYIFTGETKENMGSPNAIAARTAAANGPACAEERSAAMAPPLQIGPPRLAPDDRTLGSDQAIDICW
jgi:hypothetical protein